MIRNCFVISPIGTENSEIREHADDVFDFIVKPAAEKAGFKAHRGDHSSKPGKITEQMYSAILNDDLIIAIISYKNPNVFYELAVAQCAARPVIILNHVDHEIPFDIKDLRVVHYDLRPRQIKKDTYVGHLFEAIQQLDGDTSEPLVPFNPILRPLGSTEDNIQIFECADEVMTARIATLIRNAKERFWLMGTSQYWWLKRENMVRLIREKCTQGCDVRILIMDENNAALKMMLRDPDHQLQVVESEINSSFQGWQSLATEFENLKIRKVRNGAVLQAANLTENEVAYTPYMLSVTSGQSPSMIVNNNHPYYRTLESEFEFVWSLNNEL